ncbi:MAG: hypothetical protein V9H26_09935 [Verrucomicrobiota bacterium]
MASSTGGCVGCPDIAGPNSSVPVVINGNQTIQVNKALYATARVIDSDADGVPNFYDLTPFGGVQIDSIARNPSPVGFLLSWDGAANTIYRVEYRTNLTVRRLGAVADGHERHIRYGAVVRARHERGGRQLPSAITG